MFIELHCICLLIKVTTWDYTPFSLAEVSTIRNIKLYREDRDNHFFRQCLGACFLGRLDGPLVRTWCRSIARHFLHCSAKVPTIFSAISKAPSLPWWQCHQHKRKHFPFRLAINHDKELKGSTEDGANLLKAEDVCMHAKYWQQIIIWIHDNASLCSAMCCIVA